MKNFSSIRFGMVISCLLFFAFQSNAKIEAHQPTTEVESLMQQQGNKKKLSLKERWTMKRLKKMSKKRSNAKENQKQSLFDGLLWKVLLGVALVVIGVFAILSSIFTLSIGGLLMSIALIVVGALVIAWGALDAVL